MAKKLVDVEALRNTLYDADAITMYGMTIISQFPTVEVVSKEQYEELRENFVDYVCSGVRNQAPYCKNSCDECVDDRGWCTYRRCRGFNPDGRVYN